MIINGRFYVLELPPQPPTPDPEWAALADKLEHLRRLRPRVLGLLTEITDALIEEIEHRDARKR